MRDIKHIIVNCITVGVINIEMNIMITAIENTNVDLAQL